MTTYTAIANSEIDADSPLTAGLMTNIRDNPIAMAEGASSAPSIVGAWRLLGTASASASSTIDFENLFDSSHELYRLAFWNVDLSVDAAMHLRLGVYAGSTTWDTAGYDYALQSIYGVTPNNSGMSGNSQAQILLSDQTLEASSGVPRAAGEIVFYDPADTDYTYGQWVVVYSENAGFTNVSHTVGGFRFETAKAQHSARLLLSTGNFSAGEFRLHGLVAASYTI